MFESLMMFVGGYEWVWIIVIVGVLLFGAKKIPELARTLGKSRGEFEKGKMEGDKELNDLKEKKDE
jgi:sec-independent protein translocase protein TatA